MTSVNGSGSASEVKFLVTEATGLQIRDWVRGRMSPDPHGVGPHGDEYCVSTLYLDTDDRDVFHRRGSYGRSKYRVRRYGDDHRVFLERKLRTGSYLAKRRTDVALDVLARLDAAANEHDGIRWFCRRVSTRRLRPVCRVSYSRTARLAGTANGDVRLTLDHSLSAAAADHFTVDGPSSATLLSGLMILELKFRGSMPALFRELAGTFALTPGRASKYRVAADALGIAQLAPDEGAPYTLHA